MQTRVGAVFVFVSFTSLLSIAGVPAHLNEIKVMLISMFHQKNIWLLLIYKNGTMFLIFWDSSFNIFSIILFYMQIYSCEEANGHSKTFVFLIGQFFSSIPLLFLLSICSSLVFYFLIGLRNEFNLLVYFTLNFFMCLFVNEGLVLLVASISRSVFWSTLILANIHVSLIPQSGV